MAKRGRPQDERIKMIPLDLIDEPKYQARSGFNEDKLQTLKRSIKQIGVLNPVLLKETGDERYEIIAGHRRFVACQQLGEAALPARIVGGGDLYGELAKLHENVEREDLTVMDEARSYEHLMKIYKLSQAEIAEKAGKSEGYVSQRLALLAAPSLVIEALDDGIITFSVAREFAKIDDENELRRLLMFAANNGVTPNVARAWRLQWEATKELNPDKESGGETINYAPSTYASGKFTCESCQKETDINTMRIIKVCPPCQDVIKNA